MRLLLIFTLSLFFASCAHGNETVYRGSTPAGPVVRQFLGISLTDSMDFIRWKISISGQRYELSCQYGIGKPNTSGFIDEKQVHFDGESRWQGSYGYLKHGKETMGFVEINSFLLQLVDEQKELLSGNGGFSYTLNAHEPQIIDQFNLASSNLPLVNTMVFEGRTPCQELSTLLGLEKGATCFKLKWYFVFNLDSTTGKPSRYYMNGTGYRKESMNQGSWQVIQRKDGREMLKLTPDESKSSIYLLCAGKNILYFTDPEGKLYVGNEDFSYTLNRRATEVLSNK